ncbi:MAG: DUF4394 domain-containing protein, partial [Planctomycetaceae bacterium]|nr:DUF4394 domain-containing protein [Planctomycetaceae bacterium]
MLRKLAMNLFGVKGHRRVSNWASAQVQIEMLESRLVPTALLGLTTSNKLIQFDSSAPTTITNTVKVTGLAAGEDLVSIDSRPANGLVYGLTNQNTLYTLNPNSGVATRVGAGAASFLPTGSRIEIDFNPSVDRLRVVTINEQNFRLNPATGAIVDSDTVAGGVQADTLLAYAAGDVNVGRNPNVIGAAYDRNFQGSTVTTLFGIDYIRNTLVRSGGVDGAPSPNGGQLSTVGALGVNAGSRIGFDIDDDGTAFAALKGRLHTINLTTGAATEVGKIGSGATLDSLTALPREEVIFGVTTTNRLVSFRANDPGKLLSSVPITNLNEGETISAIDFRTATGELFALSSTNRALRINPATGQGTVVGATLDGGLFTAGAGVGFDFNPTVDRLRIVNASNDNLRFNPVTSAIVDGDTVTGGTQADTDLSYLVVADPIVDPNIVAVAYDRNDNSAETATTLFGIDSTLNTLVRQGAVDGAAGDVDGGGGPNGGLLTTLGSLGVDPTDVVGFDISGGGGSLGNGAALAVMQLQGEAVSKLFRINTIAGLSNQPLGTASLVGTVGGGALITAMAIAPPTIQFSQATFKATEKGGMASIVITRTGGSANVATVAFSALAGTAQVDDFTSPNA